jgi:hypothetical protein
MADLTRPTGPFDPNNPLPPKVTIPNPGPLPPPRDPMPVPPKYGPQPNNPKAAVSNPDAATNNAALQAVMGDTATGDPRQPAAPPATTAPVAPPAAKVAPVPSTPNIYGADWVPSKDGSGWVPPGHADAWSAQPGNSAPAAPAAPAAPPPAYGTPAPATTNGPAPTPIQAQAAAAQTYSATPGADADQSTMNQGAQDVFRNSLLQRATQSTEVDTNDPTFRGVADNFAASQERARRNATDMAAESAAGNGMATGSGLMDNERRMQNEKSAQASSGFESQLALSELQNKRQEIAGALEGLGTSIGGDQARALTDKLAQLDATIKRESLSQSGQLGNADISLRDRLGTQGNNLSAMDMYLRNQQQNNRLGFDIGNANADHNNAALRALLGS